MKLVLAALHFANLRNYESVIRGLAERGHFVHLIADEPETFGGQALVERLASAHPTVTWGWAPSLADEPWYPFAQKVRYSLDYVRFLAPRYADVPKLRLRNVERAARFVRWTTAGVGAAVVGQRLTVRLLKWLERHMPRSRHSDTFLQQQAPDALLLTSLTFSRSSQMEQLKAAKALGIRTAACILSWDHLSSKSLLHIPPDLTVVWNDVQKQEATSMHQLDAARVVVTGAQCYDQWFDRQPSRTREEFCTALGLDPSRRLLLYVCSTMSPVPDPVEPVFVREWVQAIRASDDPELRNASILIRPHPERLREWKNVSVEDIEHVAVHGRIPLDSDAKADYFDSLFHSDAVIGLCTSVFLEAAIVGRPVLTLLLPAYRMHQDGMAHFRYLLTVGGGLLHTASDLPAHLSQLSVAVQGRGARDERNLRFVREFIRPFGLDTPATPVFVDAVERLLAEPAPRADAAFSSSSLGRRCVAMLVAWTRTRTGRWLTMDGVDDERAQSEQTREDDKRRIVADREARRQAKADEQTRALQQKETIRRQKASEHRTRWRQKRRQQMVAAVRTRLRRLVDGGAR